MNKKILFVLLSLLIIVTCVSCKTNEKYLVKDYLVELANKSGISLSLDYDEIFKELLAWKIVKKEDEKLKDEYLNYAFLKRSIDALIEDDSERLGLIKKHQDSIYIDDKEAMRSIELATNYINNKKLDKKYYLKLKDSDTNIMDDNFNFEDIEELIIEDSFVVDFDQIEIIPYDDKTNQTHYVNPKYNLLASQKADTFEYNGFKISYVVSLAGIKVNISKTNENGIKFYGDISINKIEPAIKWHYQKGDVKNAYFKMNFNTVEKFGISNNKYQNYYLDFKDLDASSFMKMLKSSIKKADNDIDAKIPLFKIKIPLKEIPVKLQT